MSEEKKDAFTFSDKIKSSKPAFNPFSKRASSKIGNNGKPKKTIFERTRRDAPFFIAALLALLLLPFLYRYSGTVEEDLFVTPGTMDEDYISERFDYDPTLAGGEVMQLAGRDPMSLIKGWGDGAEEEESSESAYSFDRDSLSDEYGPSTSVHTVSKSYRRNAPGAARAAFRRNPTKINELRGASLNARGGGGLGSRFGGANLRAAAKRDSAGGPKKGIKPVALQPLRAAGSPSRSYFGQGGATQARASRDAMGKDNAAQALKDAMFAPIENRRLGGLGEGLFASGGGPGKFDRRMDYKGITPWWWDMMKDREQKKWEWEYFLWRRNLIEPLIKQLGMTLAHIMDGILNCLITGEDDGAMGSMWGSSATGATAGGCKWGGKDPAMPREEWCKTVGQSADQDVALACSADKYYKKYCEAKKFSPKDVWSDGHGAGGELGPWGKRMWCLGNSFKYKMAGGAKDQYNCEKIDKDHMYRVVGTGKAANWRYKYHAIVVEDKVGGKSLCKAKKYMDRTPTVAGVGKDARRTGTLPGHVDVKENGGPAHHSVSESFKENGQIENTQPQSEAAGCVIYLAKGDLFNYAKYRSEVEKVLDQAEGFTAADFPKIRPLFIEGYVMEKPLATDYNGNMITKLPALRNVPPTYVDFLYEYVNNQTGIFNVQRERNTKGSFWHPGGGGMASHRCNLVGFGIKGRYIYSLDNPAKADVTYDTAKYTADQLCVDVEIPVVDGKPIKEEKVGRTGLDAKNGTMEFTLSENVMQNVKDYLTKQSSDTVKLIDLDFHWTAYECKDVDRNATDMVSYTAEVAPVQGHSTEPECPNAGATKQEMVGECEYNFTCQEGDDGLLHWVQGEKTDPNCGEEIDVEFYRLADSFRVIPVDGLKNCAELNNLSNRQVVDIPSILPILAKAKTVYEKNNPNKRLEYSEDCVTIANLSDALRILGEYNGGKVPISAVCVLGKTIGLNSHDPHIKDQYEFNNMFGTFAAYMGLDSRYFPTEYVTKDGARVLDPRFYWCDPSGRPNPLVAGMQKDTSTQGYHFGQYVSSSAFDAALRDGPWSGFPLKAIAEKIGWRAPYANDTRSHVQANRNSYHQAYKKVFEEDKVCDIQGDMSYLQLLEYLTKVCSEGALNAKPSNGRACKKSTAGTGDHVTTGQNGRRTNDCQDADC